MQKEDINKAKIIDKIRQFEKTNVACATCFLDPREIFEFENIYKNAEYYLDGGFPETERKILVIGTMEKSKDDDFLCILEIKAQKNLSHREVLGSLLGTGIKRDVVGDIIIQENIAYVAVLKEISKYLIQNLEKIGREKVSVRIIDNIDEIEIKDNTKEINVTLASLRLDSAVSACYGLSREVSANLIKNAKVKLNYKEALNPSKQIKEEDLISVRGYGRFVVSQIVGETRKSRIRVVLKKS